MLENILEKIESLPPLPQTIEKIENFRKKKNKEIEELVKIIEKDALVITTLLKISNSSLFGFRTKVETIGRVISLLGINFTIYMTISETFNNILTTDLSPYCINVGTQRIWPARAFTLGHLTHNDLASVRIAKRATKSL